MFGWAFATKFVLYIPARINAAAITNSDPGPLLTGKNLGNRLQALVDIAVLIGLGPPESSA